MFKQFFLATLIITGMAGCKSKSAFNYSEDILAIEKSLMPDIQETEKNIAEFVTAGEYDKIADAGTKMEGLVQKKIDQLESMKAPKVKEAGNFKEASLRYFKFIKKMYTGYKNWGNAGTDEEREEELNNLRDMLEDKQEVVDDMQKAQRKYADANGFKIK